MFTKAVGCILSNRKDEQKKTNTHDENDFLANIFFIATFATTTTTLAIPE